MKKSLFRETKEKIPTNKCSEDPGKVGFPLMNEGPKHYINIRVLETVSPPPPPRLIGILMILWFLGPQQTDGFGETNELFLVQRCTKMVQQRHANLSLVQRWFGENYQLSPTTKKGFREKANVSLS